MGFAFRFESLNSTASLKVLIDFVANYNLNYPNYDVWVQKTEAELAKGDKEAVLAFADGRLVGNVIYQRCKESSFFLELKNMRIHPNF